MNVLKAIRSFRGGSRIETPGLKDKFIQKFAHDGQLVTAINRASKQHKLLRASYAPLLQGDEAGAVEFVQKGFMNFYDHTAINPYIAIASQGPWIVTSSGSVIYDTGGYGMLGLGHNPVGVMSAMSEPQTMANIMTPSFSQVSFNNAMRAEIGHTRSDRLNSPYESFICLNSGSECVSLAMRIADIDAKKMTAADGPHSGRDTVLVSLKGSFHGRTERPAHASDSSRSAYRKFLNSFEGDNEPTLYTVEPNDVAGLRKVFETIESQNQHVELLLMEAVMGEGNPGLTITREFYDEARRLADEYRSLLLIDSIQAGLRTYGTLSIMDFPGFQDANPPDFETFSKAINGGQFPLSVLGLGPRVPEIYARGLYGNTMTTNPRALDVATAVLTEVQDLRENITQMGKHFQEGLWGLQRKHPDVLGKVTGAGLLVAAHLHPQFKAYGDPSSLEVVCRKNGLGVIHGGTNALRFTPHFYLNEAESELIVDVLDECITEFKEDPRGQVSA